MNQQSSNELTFSILWSPLPFITWICPVIGHLGIADSNGIVSDFQGPYHVGDRGRMAFGNPTRAFRISVKDIPGGAGEWDAMIHEANEVYRGRMHNIFCDNCHSHVAYALNKMNLWNVKWDMVKLCFLVFFRARFLSLNGFFAQFGPFLILLLVIIVPLKIL